MNDCEREWKPPTNDEFAAQLYKTANRIVGFAVETKDKTDAPLWSLYFVPEGDAEHVMRLYRAFARSWVGTFYNEMIKCRKADGQVLVLIWSKLPEMVDMGEKKVIYSRFVIQGVDANLAHGGDFRFPVYNNCDDAWCQWDDFWRWK